MDYDRRATNSRPLAGATPVVTDRDRAIAFFDALPQELRVALTQVSVPVSAEHVYGYLSAGYTVESLKRSIANQDAENRRRWRDETIEAVRWAGTIMRGIKI